MSGSAFGLKAIETVPPFDPSIPTLGFGVLRWMMAHLLQPDGDNAGEPFLPTAEQRRFVLWWYALDCQGQFLYRRGVLRRSKGWGKSPFVAAICLAELCGPVRFDYWDDGKPIGKAHPSPWIVVAGVSEAQTENTLSAARSMARESDLAEANGGPLDIGKTRIIHTGNDGKLHAITASSASQEGARPTFAVGDEPHHWTASNGGAALARVIRRNLAKVRGRFLETTNAHEPDAGSVAEASFLAYVAQREGRTRKKEILYDCREAPALTPEQLADEPTLREALRLAYGDSTWVDLDPLVGEIYDPSTPVEEGRRFYLNQIVAASNSWLRPDQYEAVESEDVPPLLDGETVTLGLDGGLTDDATALVAVRVSDGAPFLLDMWEKPEGSAGKGWEIDKSIVRDLVDNAFTKYDVVAFFSDVAYWETDVDRWRDLYAEKLLVKATTRHSVAWDMRGHLAETTQAVEALHRAFVDKEIPVHPGDGRLRRHVLNARKRPNRWGVSFSKETAESPKKVDGLAAMLLARMARAKVIAENALAKRRRPAGRLVGF